MENNGVKVNKGKLKEAVAKKIYGVDKAKTVAKEEEEDRRNHTPIAIGSKMFGGKVTASNKHETVVRKGGKSYFYYTRKINAMGKSPEYDVKPHRSMDNYVDDKTYSRWSSKKV